MGAPIRLYELPPSPNNVKVRLGLHFKGLAFERRPLSVSDFPGDRSEIVKISRQPLTPVLVHGTTAIFDSGSILRYLEANFPETPPLFSEDYQEMKKIEEWEWFGRARLYEPVGVTFREAQAPKKDPEALARARKLMRELTGRMEDRLARSEFLAADRITAADVTAAPYVALAMIPAPTDNPIVRFFHENFALGEGRDRTRAWAGRILAYDERA